MKSVIKKAVNNFLQPFEVHVAKTTPKESAASLSRNAPYNIILTHVLKSNEPLSTNHPI